MPKGGLGEVFVAEDVEMRV